MIFELITGDFLFEPKRGQYYDKDDDHLAQMIELLGGLPKNSTLAGRHVKKYFGKNANLQISAVVL